MQTKEHRRSRIITINDNEQCKLASGLRHAFMGRYIMPQIPVNCLAKTLVNHLANHLPNRESREISVCVGQSRRPPLKVQDL